MEGFLHIKEDFPKENLKWEKPVAGGDSMKGNTTSILLFLVLFIVMPITTKASTVTLGFVNITNANTDIAAQLSATLWDEAEALSNFNLTLDTGPDIVSVLFTFSNNVGVTSNVSEIYFDDESLFSQSAVYNSLGGFTNFTGWVATPGDLPGGENVGFEATIGLSADVVPGPPENGINTSSDILGISFLLDPGKLYSDVVSGLADGSLRIGLHVRSIGEKVGSDSFVNTPVPIPSAVLLLGSGLVGLVGIRRKSGNMGRVG